jgi:hypothetical protein
MKMEAHPSETVMVLIFVKNLITSRKDKIKTIRSTQAAVGGNM